MDSVNLIEKKIARVADLLEQISDVDRMIAIHDAGIMKSQYSRRRNQFLNELKVLLGELNIQPKDLIAA